MTDNITIWRIEHGDTGEGPYNGPNNMLLIYGLMVHSDCDHPNTSDDFTFEERSNIGKHNLVHGFHNAKLLHEWFSKGELKTLRQNGYISRQYIVPKSDVFVSRSGKQCLFRKP